MEYSRRVTAATAQTPQLLKLGAQSRRRKLGAADLMKPQEYPMRITMFALSASMRPALAQTMCRQAASLANHACHQNSDVSIQSDENDFAQLQVS